MMMPWGFEAATFWVDAEAGLVWEPPRGLTLCSVCGETVESVERVGHWEPSSVWEAPSAWAGDLRFSPCGHDASRGAVRIT